MTTLLTTELIDRCHEGAKSKGFWDVTPPQGQQLMLVISELAEALEAHRKGRAANLNAYYHACDKRIEQWEASNPPKRDDICCPYFESYVKDSVGDELADAYIRLCDFAGGYGLDKQLILLEKVEANTWVMRGTFGEQLLVCTEAICDLSRERRRSGGHGLEGAWCDALTRIEVVCMQEEIDLATHIDLKLRYNATRGHKHNKAY